MLVWQQEGIRLGQCLLCSGICCEQGQRAALPPACSLKGYELLQSCFFTVFSAVFGEEQKKHFQIKYLLHLRRCVSCPKPVSVPLFLSSPPVENTKHLQRQCRREMKIIACFSKGRCPLSSAHIVLILQSA